MRCWSEVLRGAEDVPQGRRFRQQMQAGPAMRCWSEVLRGAAEVPQGRRFRQQMPRELGYCRPQAEVPRIGPNGRMRFFFFSGNLDSLFFKQRFVLQRLSPRQSRNPNLFVRNGSCCRSVREDTAFSANTRFEAKEATSSMSRDQSVHFVLMVFLYSAPWFPRSDRSLQCSLSNSVSVVVVGNLGERGSSLARKAHIRSVQNRWRLKSVIYLVRFSFSYQPIDNTECPRL